MALRRGIEFLLLFLLLSGVASAVSLFTVESEQTEYINIKTSDVWVVGKSYDVIVRVLENVKDVQLLISDEAGNSFAPDMQVIGENGVFVYSVKVPPVDPGKYYATFTAYNGIRDFTQVKAIEIKDGFWRGIKLKFAQFINWWSS